MKFDTIEAKHAGVRLRELFLLKQTFSFLSPKRKRRKSPRIESWLAGPIPMVMCTVAFAISYNHEYSQFIHECTMVVHAIVDATI